MYCIKEYDEKYNKKINDFVISIYVEEFGFEESRKYLEENDNSVYVRTGGQVLIAVDEDDNIVGTIALVKHDNQNAEIKKFYVKKEYRGQGVSKQLYERLLLTCKNAEFKRIFLGTFNKLEAATKFYLRARI